MFIRRLVSGLAIGFAVSAALIATTGNAAPPPVAPPESLEEVRTLKTLKARLRAIEQFDSLVLTGSSAVQAIERCDQAEFERMRERVLDVISTTQESDRLLAELDKRRLADARRMAREQSTLIKYIGPSLREGTAGSLQALKSIFNAARDAAPRGSPDPLSVAARAAFAAAKKTRGTVKEQLVRSRELEKIGKALEEVKKAKDWESQLTSKEVVANFAELHKRHLDLIGTAQRLLAMMDNTFGEHVCARCVGPKKKVVAEAKPIRKGVLEQLRLLATDEFPRKNCVERSSSSNPHDGYWVTYDGKKVIHHVAIYGAF